jgi:hypothetical protein
MRVLLGGATTAAIQASTATLNGALAAMSNATCSNLTFEQFPGHTRGTASNYQDVEDKAVLTFLDPAGAIHSYQIACPKTATFLADQETVNAAETNTAAVIAVFTTVAYGRYTDLSPLTFVGGVRKRHKMRRRANIFTLDPSLTIPEA